MQHARQAGRLAQPVVGRAGVEDHEFFRARQRRERAKAAFIEIGDHETNMVGRDRGRGGRDAVLVRHDIVLEDESLAGQLAGLVVVGDADPRPGNPLILERRFEPPIGRADEARPPHEGDRKLVGARRADKKKTDQEERFHLNDCGLETPSWRRYAGLSA